MTTEARWSVKYEKDVLAALAFASRRRDAKALAHRRAFGGNCWSAQDLCTFGTLPAGVPVASVHRAAVALITKGLVAKRKISGANYYTLTDAGDTRTRLWGPS